MTTAQLRAALYARVSSQQQADANTIASQVEAIRDRVVIGMEKGFFRTFGEANLFPESRPIGYLFSGRRRGHGARAVSLGHTSIV